MKKKIIITILAITTIISAYALGTTQAKTITEVNEIEKQITAVPAGYVDVKSNAFCNNYIDMRQVTDFVATDTGLQLYLEDGSGYYWER